MPCHILISTAASNAKGVRVSSMAVTPPVAVMPMLRNVVSVGYSKPRIIMQIIPPINTRGS